MHRLFIYVMLSTVLRTNAQDLPAQLLFDNEPILLVASELDHLLAKQLISTEEASLLSQFFQNGGVLSSLYQLQGILARDLAALSPLSEQLVLPRLQSQTSKKVTGLYELRSTLPAFSVVDRRNFIWTCDTNYTGPNFAFQQRISLSLSNWRFGLQLAKDVGEPIWHSTPTPGIDCSTGFLAWVAPFKTYQVQKILIGTYQIQWGQGLHLWTSRGLGKSIDLLQLAKKPLGLKPYQGRDEQRYLQGLSGSFQIWKHELLVLASVKNIDAKTIQDTLQPEFNWAFTTGLHRTTTELAKRKRAFEQIYGMGLRRQAALWQYGILVLYQQVQTRQLFADSMPGTQPSALRFWSASAYVQGPWRQCYLYGEWASIFKKTLLFSQAFAVNLGLVYYLDPRLEVGLNCRNYAAHYQALYANPIANSTMGSNERGVIFQLKWQVQKNTILRLSNEHVFIPEFKWPAQFPKRSADLRLQLLLNPSKKRSFTQQLILKKQEMQRIQIRSYSEIQLQLNEAERFSCSLQLGLNGAAENISRSLEWNWHRAPLGAKCALEWVYGMFQIPAQGLLLYSHPNLIGFGTQSTMLRGVGTYSLVAVQFNSKAHLQLNFSIGTKYFYAPSLQREYLVQLGFRKKI